MTALKREDAYDTGPVSISGLAEACGVSRQRIYTMVKEGLIDATPLGSGAYVIMPAEARRVMKAARRVSIRGGQHQIRFDLERI